MSVKDRPGHEGTASGDEPGDGHLVETRLDSSDVFSGSLLQVRRDSVQLPDGARATREYIVHPGAVMIVPRLADGSLLMERQYRYPIGQVFIEFPAGKIDPGEDPLVAAKRELTEETGYTAARWSRLASMHPVISYSTERIDMFIAEELTHVGTQLDDGEFIETFSTTLGEALARLDRGEITDSKTMIGLLLLARQAAAPSA